MRWTLCQILGAAPRISANPKTSSAMQNQIEIVKSPPVNFWEFGDLQMVSYPVTITATKKKYNFPDKSILTCENACLVGFATRAYDADRVSVDGNDLVTDAFLKKCFLTFQETGGRAYFQDFPLEWAIGKYDGGRENFMLRLPMHGIDLTNSYFEYKDADLTAFTANVGHDVETFWFFVDGDKYPRQAVL